jgi:hypothetical protein
MEQDGIVRSGSRLRSAAATPAQEGRGEKLADKPEQKDFEDCSSFEISRIEDDRASSIAATADEDGPDFDALSTKRLSMFSLAPSVRLSQGIGDTRELGLNRTPGESPAAEKDNEDLDQAGAATKEKDPVAELKDSNLPTGISKVANVYRTNEWAKHIAEADQPEILEDLNPDEPSVHVDVGRIEEMPRPVETRALSPEQMQPQFFRTASNPYRRNSDGHKRPVSSSTPIYSAQRQDSNTSERRSRLETRSSLKPLVQQTLVEAPSEDGFASTVNLMDERSVRVSTQPTTTNFNGITPRSSANPLSPAESAILQPSTSGHVNAGDLTHEQRKSLLLAQLAAEQRQHHPSSAQRPATSRQSSSMTQNLIYDSHQPKRFNSVNQIKQNAMLTQWRQSLQQESFDHQPANTERQRARQSMIDQLRYRDYQELKQGEERRKRESRIEMAMRTSQLTDKHKSAMKKMQAQANAASK